MKVLRNIGVNAVSDHRFALSGVPVVLRFRWMPRVGAWEVSMRTVAGVALMQGARLTCGALHLSRGRPYGSPHGALIAVDTQGTLDVVGRNDLSSGRVLLGWMEPDDVPSSTSSSGVSVASVVVD